MKRLEGADESDDDEDEDDDRCVECVCINACMYVWFVRIYTRKLSSKRLEGADKSGDMIIGMCKVYVLYVRMKMESFTSIRAYKTKYLQCTALFVYICICTLT